MNCVDITVRVSQKCWLLSHSNKWRSRKEYWKEICNLMPVISHWDLSVYFHMNSTRLKSLTWKETFSNPESNQKHSPESPTPILKLSTTCIICALFHIQQMLSGFKSQQDLKNSDLHHPPLLGSPALNLESTLCVVQQLQ